MAYVGRQPLAGEVIILDDIQSQFNGVLTTFNLTRTVNGLTTSFAPVTTGQLLVSLGGTIQEPDGGGTRGFKVDGTTIVFASAPPANTDCFIVSYGNITNITSFQNYNPFTSIACSESIYYYKPEHLTLTRSGTITDGSADNFFTLSKTVTVDSNTSISIGDGETLTVDLWDTSGYAGASNSYVLPTASTTTLGGVKVDGTTITISGGTITATTPTVDYNNLTNTPDLSLLGRIDDATRTTNDILAWDGNNWVDTNTAENLVLSNARGTFQGTTPASAPSSYTHIYADRLTTGLSIVGVESALDITGQDSGAHASSILLRGGDNGFGLYYDPTGYLRLRSFTATANDFHIHDNGSNVSNLLSNIDIRKSNGAIRLNSTGVYDSFIKPAYLWVDGPYSSTAHQSHLGLQDTSTTGGANTGSKLGFYGHDGISQRTWVQIGGHKENGTSGNYDAYFNVLVREDGVATPPERFRINSDGFVGINVGLDTGRTSLNPYNTLDLTYTNNDTDPLPTVGLPVSPFPQAGQRITNTSTTTGALSLTHYRSGTSDWLVGCKYGGATDAGNFVIYNEIDLMLTLTRTNRLGLGQSDPDALIHVSAESSNNNPFAIFEIQDAYKKLIHFHESSNAYALGQYGAYIGYDAAGNNLELGLYNAGSNNGIITFNRDTTLFRITGNHATFCVDQDDSAGVSRFGSYSSSDVAIVTGRATPTGSSRIHIENGDGEAMRITDSNTVAISTPTTVDPDTLSGDLVITGRSALYAADKIGYIAYGNSPTIATPASRPYCSIGNDGTTSYLIAGSGGTQDVDLEIQTAVGGTETTKVWLDHDGQVGLGSSPDTIHRLNVYGDSTIPPSIQIRSTTDGVPPRLVLQPNSSNQSASCRIEFWEGFNTTTYTGANASIEYDGTTAYGGDGAVLIKGYTATPDQVLCSFSRSGTVNIPGTLSKGSGSFRISHPLPEKSDTHDLVHSFVEGPQADLIYRGRVDLVDGSATINVDTAAGMTEGTFVLLCGDVQCFTSNETGWTAVRGSVSDNILTIEAQDPTCTDTISWMVIGERKDQHMIDAPWTDETGKVIVEPEKLGQQVDSSTSQD